jgi:hypothetical protein
LAEFPSSRSLATVSVFASQDRTVPSYDPLKNIPVSLGYHATHDVAYLCPTVSLTTNESESLAPAPAVASTSGPNVVVVLVTTFAVFRTAARAPAPRTTHTSDDDTDDDDDDENDDAVSYTRMPPSIHPTHKYLFSTPSSAKEVGAVDSTVVVVKVVEVVSVVHARSSMNVPCSARDAVLR